MPDKIRLDKLYSESYAAASHYEVDPERCSRTAAPYYESIRGVLMDYGVSGTVLDCGSGWGGLCRLLREGGFECRGVEPSAKMAEYCRRHGLPVLHGGIEALEGESFCAIVMCTVFEHLCAHVEWLEKARSLLAPRGLLVTLQPTARFASLMGLAFRMGMREARLPRLHDLFCPPWHTVFFSLEGMRRVAAAAGFSLIEVRPAPQGKSSGAGGILRLAFGAINKLGSLALGVGWPLLVAHTFILRRN